MDTLNQLITIIDIEKENMSSNNYLQLCNNLQQLQKQCFIQHNEIQTIDTKAKKMYIKQLEHLRLSTYEKAHIIKQFCKYYNLQYNVEYNAESIRNFEHKMKEDLSCCGSIVYEVFKDEFKDFYNAKKMIILTAKEEMLIERISMFSLL